MPKLIWDEVGKRVFQSGLDQGVVYLDDGSAIPWNGLTSINEESDFSVTPVHFDGQKIHDLVQSGDYAAEITAVTYPDELVTLEGFSSDVPGAFFGEQPPGMFNLSYRSKIGNDIAGPDAGYKIHILYNVTAIPKDKTYASVSDDPSLVEFSWDITAVPEEIPGNKPTAHIVLDSRKVDPLLLEQVEELLYGGDLAFPQLPSLTDMVDLLKNFFRVQIVDNGDGSWTATANEPGYIVDNGDGSFVINNINAIYLDEVTYQISTTRHAADAPLISIRLYANGVWVATSDSSDLIIEDEKIVYFTDVNYEPVASDQSGSVANVNGELAYKATGLHIHRNDSDGVDHWADVSSMVEDEVVIVTTGTGQGYYRVVLTEAPTLAETYRIEFVGTVTWVGSIPSVGQTAKVHTEHVGGSFIINNVEAPLVGPDMYRITDTY